MPAITASVYTSHVPAIGAAIDLGKTDEPYWAPLFDGLRVAQAVDAAQHKPDVIFLVYNDHATAFSLDIIPTFAIGTRGRVPAGRRRLGPAPGARRGRPSGAGVAHRPVA